MTRDERELSWQRFQQHKFQMPSPDLAPYVAGYWIVTWEYTHSYRQLIVPYPNVHLSFGGGVAEVHGVSSGHLFKELDGSGRVFGVAFQPGCFRPFLGGPVQSITDRSIPAAEVFRDLPDESEVHTVEKMLRANLPARDPKAELATEIVNRIIAEPTIKRVDLLANQFGTSVRQLQRLFAEDVGVGPKWVIRRYRLHEVTERMAAGARIDWAALAADLGYADQAHFIRDFTSMFGESPTRYAERY
ncbi:MAG TPA: helix-turn-helix domain-containing protein [Actinomycetota bacterium]|nr:helix-turn-helix domain-containing protein [Actinomycetota bacterium]